MGDFYEVMTFLDDEVYSYWEKEDGEIFCHMCGQLGDETVPFDGRRFCPHCQRRMITDSVYNMLSRIATRLNKNRLNKEFGTQITLSDLEESYLKKDIEAYENCCRNMNKSENAKWIKMSDASGVYWVCGKCHETLPRVWRDNPEFDIFPRLISVEKTNYCPHCGVKMEVDNG